MSYSPEGELALEDALLDGGGVSANADGSPNPIAGSPSQSGEGAAAGDETTWTFDAATGLETRKTYADGSSVVKSYDAFNRLATETNARGRFTAYTYEQERGLLLSTACYYPAEEGAEPVEDSYTPARRFAYNHLGQLVQVSERDNQNPHADGSVTESIRTLGYNAYGEAETDSLSMDGDTHLITELRDSFGRSAGYTYAKNGAVQQTVSTGYGEEGRINSAGFVHGGEQKLFGYEYLQGSNLLHRLTKPNNMVLTQSYEPARDLLIGMAYHRGSSLVVQREYSYDALGRPTTRNTARQGAVVNDIFAHNTRSELSSARVNGISYGYAYDNIGNRTAAVEDSSGVASSTEYTTNQLNQYTRIVEDDESVFLPEFDADGNQTRVQTSTGSWDVSYNNENRPTDFTAQDAEGNFTTVHCSYDYMGRRSYKKVISGGEVVLHQRYIYRGYLQIACIDLTRSHHPVMWLLLWDPTQPVATRPLAIQKDGTWRTYGLDLTKNVCEVFGSNGYINTAYTYTPFGEVTASGSVTQPIQWSSEFHDEELGMVYYNYRHYNTRDGRWMGRDMIQEKYSANAYSYGIQSPIIQFDALGLLLPKFDRKNIKIIDLRNLNLNIPVVNGGRTMADTVMSWPVFETFASCYGNILGLVITYPPKITVTYYAYHIDKQGNTEVEHEDFHVNSNISHWNWFVQMANHYEKEYNSCDECKRHLKELERIYEAYQIAAEEDQKNFDLRTSHSLLPE